MKALRAALAALMLWAPIAEARGLVILYGGTTPQAQSESHRAVVSVLDAFDADFDVVNSGSVMTEWARFGKVPMGANGITAGAAYSAIRTYDWVAHVGLHKNQVPTGGARWDSLLLGARWPTVHQMFFGAGTSAGSKWNDGGGVCGGCSTGVGSNIAQGSYSHYNLAYYGSRTPITWSHPNIIPTVKGSSIAGYWRPLVNVGARNLACYANNPETDTPTMTSNRDTVAVWMRQAVTAGGAPTGARLVFANWTSQVAAGDVGIVAMTIAAVDSALGGTLIRRPVKAAVVIDRWGGIGAYGGSAAGSSTDTLVGGQFCRPDTCDSTNVKATMDSLNALRIPITFALDPDSMLAYPWQDRMMKRVALYRVTPQVWTGAKTAPDAGSGNASASRPLDIFGHIRHRAYLPSGATSYNAACSATDSSISCLLRAAFAKCETRWPGRVDRVIHAPYEDWTNLRLNRANATGWDSLMSTLYWAGVKGLRVNAYNSTSDVGRSGGQPIGWTTATMRFAVYENADDSVGGFSRTPVAYMPTIATRGSEFFGSRQKHYYGNLADDCLSTPGSQHDIKDEFMIGLFTGSWYLPHQLFSTNGHNMQVRTRIYKVAANTLGGIGDGQRASRPHYWGIKWMANEFAYINRLAGRTVCRLTTPEDVATEPIR